MTDEFTQFDHGLDKLRDEAATVQRNLGAAKRAIEADPNLSDQGRREQIATLRDSAQTRLDQLKAAEVKAIKDKTTSLERSVFGYTSTTDPSEIISRRDADDRADRLQDSKEAEALLERAERAGDKHLAQAIIRVAAVRGYQGVVRAYESEHPATGSKLALLAQIQQGTTTANYLLRRTAAYSARLL
ncbi:hypothetical protein [Amnibacterium setariae]|uniref:Uncharacterized protein n=1 Tax=Amnibacterium setariae TaxID=2306585 RepID=A0A3A1TS09_9MICO|nr:hypothetical protein [Amnibacterium setariae]RIX26475.1 hypothetical protein D1781_16195 [Amnibacterium setariae]